MKTPSWIHFKILFLKREKIESNLRNEGDYSLKQWITVLTEYSIMTEKLYVFSVDVGFKEMWNSPSLCTSKCTPFPSSNKQNKRQDPTKEKSNSPASGKRRIKPQFGSQLCNQTRPKGTRRKRLVIFGGLSIIIKHK